MASGATSPTVTPADLPHDTLQPNIIACAAITWVIAATFVGLRFYARKRILNALNSSDWLILVALIFSFGLSAGESEAAVHGAGRHIWDLDPNNIKDYLGWGISMWYSLLFYTLTLCFSKMSIAMLYVHLFAFLWLRRTAQVVMAIVVISNIYLVCIIFTACIPLQAYWDMTVPHTYCHKQSVWWGNAILLLVTDFVVFLVPLPAVWTLRMARKQKYMLLGIFGLGFFVCIISIVRLVYIVYFDTHPQTDFFYTSIPLTYWTFVEVNGAIVCACLMTLKPLISRIFPKMLSPASDQMPDSGIWANLPTIGSMPWRGRSKGSKQSSGREDPTLEDIDEGLNPFVTRLEMDDAVLAKEVGADPRGANDDLEKWRRGFPVPSWASGPESHPEVLRDKTQLGLQLH